MGVEIYSCFQKFSAFRSMLEDFEELIENDFIHERRCTEYQVG